MVISSRPHYILKQTNALDWPDLHATMEPKVKGISSRSSLLRWWRSRAKIRCEEHSPAGRMSPVRVRWLLPRGGRVLLLRSVHGGGVLIGYGRNTIRLTSPSRACDMCRPKLTVTNTFFATLPTTASVIFEVANHMARHVFSSRGNLIMHFPPAAKRIARGFFSQHLPPPPSSMPLRVNTYICSVELLWPDLDLGRRGRAACERRFGRKCGDLVHVRRRHHRSHRDLRRLVPPLSPRSFWKVCSVVYGVGR